MTFVYVHLETDTGNPFYVGIGEKVARAHNLKDRSKHHQNVVAKHGIKIVVVGEVLTWEAACEWEKRLIAGYRKAGHRLVNMTDGGDGLNNPTEEVRAKISANCSMKRPEVRAKISGENSPMKRPEVRAKSSATWKSMGEDHPSKRPEVRAKKSAAMKALGENNPMKRPEARAKNSAAIKALGENHPSKSPEVRAKLSVAAKAQWAARRGAAQ